MYPCPVTIKINNQPMTFTCTEAAFQAMKAPDCANLFLKLNGFEAKELGKTVELKPNWDTIKITVMEIIIYAKFKQNPHLQRKLIRIKEPIVEENTWGDTFWGTCNNHGKNNLGKILEWIRYESQTHGL